MQSFNFRSLVIRISLVTIFLFGISPSISEASDVPANVEEVLDEAAGEIEKTPSEAHLISKLKQLVEQRKPPIDCGERVRKEVRMMSRDEWKTYTDAINSLKSKVCTFILKSYLYLFILKLNTLSYYRDGLCSVNFDFD